MSLDVSPGAGSTDDAVPNDVAPGHDATSLGAVLVAGWSLALAAYAALAVWLALHPAAISSDDALFFMHGLTRFSILDFSPQFPGYPGFVALGRLLLPFAADPLHALALLTGLTALALPPLAAMVAWRVRDSAWTALAAFAVALSCPLLPDLALSLLSDGTGILFLLVFLVLLPGKRGHEAGRLPAFMAGAALAFAGACRPSDAMLLAGAELGALVAAPRLLPALLLGNVAVVLPVAIVVFALEGSLYLGEGLRFVSGHATLWGNTAFAAGGRHGGWLAAIRALPGGPAMIVLAAIGAVGAFARIPKAPPAIVSASMAFLAHASWIAAFQNPDHLRHLTPLLILGGLLLALLPRRRAGFLPVVLYLAAELYGLLATAGPDPRQLPPLMAAASFLEARPGAAVATNEGVFTLRARLSRVRVYDLHYPADAALGLATTPGARFRLTTTPPSDRRAAMPFGGRFAGEEPMWLERR